MSHEDITKKPKLKANDIAHAITKAGLADIPLIGGKAAEIFSLIIVPPLSRRRDKWIISIAERLIKLEDIVKGFKIEELSKNDMFITTVNYASQVAIRNHQEEKLEALHNAVLNASLPNPPEEDIQLMFLNFVDTLTTWHLRILKYFVNSKRWADEHGFRKKFNWKTATNEEVLFCIFPELKNQKDFLKQIIKDLEVRGLISDEDFDQILERLTLITALTTDFGKQFIKFITSPIER